MPLNSKGDEIMENMKEQYGEKKGESVFYASKNAGTITGVDAAPTDYPEVPAMGQLKPLDNVGESVLGAIKRGE